MWRLKQRMISFWTCLAWCVVPGRRGYGGPSESSAAFDGLDVDAWVPTLDQLRRDPDPVDPAPDRPADANDVMRIAFLGNDR
jgi:hypothetical protein